ncbi:hypothetical protein CC78DRAFT_72301 [Lojkania enalia]|uniref:Uncharacterized protein n=1 Tax=Lojkania enalia TaxID=147567 RepID=A0A9P4K0R1_9PLEO|nr:hypothetical protein CC78DRAFT_72301 [Didymosphaeria enalia]
MPPDKPFLPTLTPFPGPNLYRNKKFPRLHLLTCGHIIETVGTHDDRQPCGETCTGYTALYRRNRKPFLCRLCVAESVGITYCNWKTALEQRAKELNIDARYLAQVIVHKKPWFPNDLTERPARSDMLTAFPYVYLGKCTFQRVAVYESIRKAFDEKTAGWVTTPKYSGRWDIWWEGFGGEAG